MTDLNKQAGVVAVVLLAGAIGFAAGRYFPIETRHEKECREWATKAAMQPAFGDPVPDLIPVLIGSCLNGR